MADVNLERKEAPSREELESTWSTARPEQDGHDAATSTPGVAPGRG